MKNFIRIFTIYFLVLTFLPCSDAANLCSSESKDETIEMSVVDDHDHSHSDCGDTCSPFCYCSCCGSSVLIPNYVANLECLEFPPLAQTTPHLASQMHGIIFPSGIWQPPQFG